MISAMQNVKHKCVCHLAEVYSVSFFFFSCCDVEDKTDFAETVLNQKVMFKPSRLSLSLLNHIQWRMEILVFVSFTLTVLFHSLQSGGGGR